MRRNISSYVALQVLSDLQLEEIPEQETDDTLASQKTLDNVDVICLTYDSADADSFAFIADLRVSHRQFTTNL